MQLICGTAIRVGDPPCPFAVRAKKMTPSTVALTYVCTNHTCLTDSGRLRQVKSSVLASASPTLGAFVPSKGRQGGNALQFSTQMRVEHGLKLKKGQVYNVLRAKQNDTGVNLAQYRLLASMLVHLQMKDQDGTYEIKTEGTGVVGRRRCA